MRRDLEEKFLRENLRQLLRVKKYLQKNLTKSKGLILDLTHSNLMTSSQELEFLLVEHREKDPVHRLPDLHLTELDPKSQVSKQYLFQKWILQEFDRRKE